MGRKQYGEILLDDGPEFFPVLEGVKCFPQGRPRDCSPIDLCALICCEHDPCLVFQHPIGVDVRAPYLQQEFCHIPKERFGDVPGPKSFCGQGLFAVISFQELCWVDFELSLARVVQAQFLAHHGFC